MTGYSPLLATELGPCKIGLSLLLQKFKFIIQVSVMRNSDYPN